MKIVKVIDQETGLTKTTDDGEVSWHQNGKLHRDDGPAFINKTFGEEKW
jgi:hypothetical protein